MNFPHEFIDTCTTEVFATSRNPCFIKVFEFDLHDFCCVLLIELGIRNASRIIIMYCATLEPKVKI